MSKMPRLLWLVILIVVALTACTNYPRNLPPVTVSAVAVAITPPPTPQITSAPNENLDPTVTIAPEIAEEATDQPSIENDPTPTVSSEVPPTDQPTPEIEQTPTKQPSSRILPASILYLSPDGQIMRLSADGVTVSQITEEVNPVLSYDVSPDGTLLTYVSNNDLILLDLTDSTRTVQIEGVKFDPEDYDARALSEIRNPDFSPDGSQIAYSMNGIHTIGVEAGAEPQLVIADSPRIDFSQPVTFTGPLQYFYGAEWSPDGTKLLLNVSFFEGGSLGIFDLTANRYYSITNEFGVTCCDWAWAADSQTGFISGDLLIYGAPGLVEVDTSNGSSVTWLNGTPAGQPASDNNFNVFKGANPTGDGALWVFLGESFDFSAPASYQLFRVADTGTTIDPVGENFYALNGTVLWAEDNSGVLIPQNDYQAQFPFNGSYQWLPVDGRPSLDLNIEGNTPKWGGVAQETILPDLPAFSQLTDIAKASFGVEEVAVKHVVNAGNNLLFIVHTTGSRNFDPLTEHQVALYTYSNGDWQEIARTDLGQFDTVTDPVSSPDYLSSGSVHQVHVTQNDLWLTIEGGIGAHSGSLEVLRFDGENLIIEAVAFSPSPSVGYIEDLDEDGTAELILDTSDPYIFAYATGVRNIQFAIRRWLDNKFINVELVPFPTSDESPASMANNTAIALASGGLWQDAQTAINEAVALAPDDELIKWNAIFINLNADGKRRVFQNSTPPSVMLAYVFAGDYESVAQVLSSYEPANLFTRDTWLIAGTVTEQFIPEFATSIQASTSAALTVQPDLAIAYLTRAWANYLADPTDPTIIPDLQQAAELEPDNPFYAGSLEFVQNN